MNSICIFIPTYNRPDCMQKWLEAVPDQFPDYFDIFISDSSEDTATETIVTTFKMRHIKGIRYKRIEKYPDRTTDLKVVEGLRELENEYDYIYLCGDGLIVDFEKLFHISQLYLRREYDVIHFYPDQENDLVEYSKGLDFARNCGWFVTYYGATIISSKVLKGVDYEELLRNYRNTGFLVWEMIFQTLASEHQRILVLKDFPVSNNPYKKSNSSYQPNRFMTFWVTNWARVVDELPAYYDEIKEHLRKDIGKHLDLYGFDNLIRLRHSGNLNKSIYEEYKMSLPRVTDKKMLYIHTMAYAPIKILDFLLGVKIRLAKIYHKIKKS